ncbi:GL21120 [Drosophila persimilis]|uniref:GL21120 n=1 Tax=Drosophila persimilis TaxID=7234 RepID=B4GXF4_DROPE|nr:GL21120 [Drosophila persimilis]
MSWEGGELELALEFEVEFESRMLIKSHWSPLESDSDSDSDSESHHKRSRADMEAWCLVPGAWFLHRERAESREEGAGRQLAKTKPLRLRLRLRLFLSLGLVLQP